MVHLDTKRLISDKSVIIYNLKSPEVNTLSLSEKYPANVMVMK